MKDAAKLGVDRDAGAIFRYIDEAIGSRLDADLKLDPYTAARSIVDLMQRRRNLSIEEIAVRFVAREVEARRRNITRVKERDAFVTIATVRTAKLVEAVRRAVEVHRETVKLEVFGELLGIEFVADGKRVTWGDATVAQHEARARWQEGQAAGAMEDAAKHRSAVQMLRDAHARTLNDLRSRVWQVA